MDLIGYFLSASNDLKTQQHYMPSAGLTSIICMMELGNPKTNIRGANLYSMVW